MRSIVTLAFVLSLYCGSVTAQGTGDSLRLSLQQCVETAIKNNADVQRKDLLKQSAHLGWTQARENMIPTLNADAYHGNNQGRSINPYTNSYIDQQLSYANYSIYSSVTLFQGLSLQNAIKQNKLAFNAASYEEQQQKELLTLNVIMSYLQVLTNEDLLALAYQQQGVSNKQVERLDIRDKDSAADPKELNDLRGQLANDQLTVVTTQNSLENAKLSLAQLMNVPYTNKLAVERVSADKAPQLLYDANAEEVYKSASGNLAIVKAADLRKESAEKAIQVAKGKGWPVVFLSGSLATNYSSAGTLQNLVSTTHQAGSSYVEYNGSQLPVIEESNTYAADKIPYTKQLNNNLNNSISIGVTIPILNNFSNKNKIAQARITAQDAAITANSVRIQLQQNVEQAYFNMTAAQNKYKVLKLQQAAFKESFRVAEVKFNAGAINSVDYVVAKNNYDKSNINLIVAGYDLAIRIKLLDYYQGKPLW
ncbi:TolC family protein [Filimonas lacunae]|nr:TolC family protein [Filimonas lacunae]